MSFLKDFKIASIVAISDIVPNLSSISEPWVALMPPTMLRDDTALLKVIKSDFF